MDNTSTLILGIALFVIMMGMGLSLTKADFQRVLKMPKAVLLGFVNQIILLPIIGFTLCKVFGIEAAIAIGVMILAACPGGATSNLVTHLAKGDVALSVTLTAINSLITVITIPLIVSYAIFAFLGENTAVEAPILEMIGKLFVIVLIPLMIGMLIRNANESLANRMDKPVRIASGALIALVIIGLMIKERANIIPYFQQALLITLALNVLTMLVGYITAKGGKLSFKQALTICIESGNQNGTLAIAIAVSLDRSDFAIAAAVYSLIMYATALLPIYVGNKAAKLEKTGIGA